MREPECPYLHALALQLQEAYRVKGEILAGHRAGLALMTPEAAILRFQKLITHHRAACPQCKLDDMQEGVSPRLKPLAPDRYRQIPEWALTHYTVK
jgi:hypothetical protein